ncbi:MAG TPA: triose-phosphate isomerase family protein, partial [Patescibacteria group bacterium]|nr:triose-phosphate isomerase family protein [Patescibacteria group bacterium]
LSSGLSIRYNEVYHNIIHMKTLYFVANWKSNKTIQEAITWLQKISNLKSQISNLEESEIIVCPSFTLLPSMKAFLEEHQLPIKLGVQDVSPFEEGAYTGAINTKQAKEFVTHAIIGHSERRRLFHETDEDVIAKIKQVLAAEITPILCISDIAQLDHYLTESTTLVDNAEKIIFVYEPPGAISGGGAYRAEDPETANQNAGEIRKKIGKQVITIYGGSVNPDNRDALFGQEYIQGGLVGQASLDAETFIKLITNS